MESDDGAPAQHLQDGTDSNLGRKMNLICVGVSVLVFLLVIVFLFLGLHLTSSTTATADVNRTKM